MRLIDADALLEAIDNHDWLYHKDQVIELITNAPTVQREGWVSVPIEPTEEMIRQGLAVEFPGTYKKYLRCPFNGTKTKIENEAQISRMTKQYKAMLQAAPTYKE